MYISLINVPERVYDTTETKIILENDLHIYDFGELHIISQVWNSCGFEVDLLGNKK